MVDCEVNQAIQDATDRLAATTEIAPETPGHLVSVQIHKKTTSPETHAAPETSAPSAIATEDLSKMGAINFFHDYLRRIAASGAQIEEWQKQLKNKESVAAWDVLTGMQYYIFAMVRSWPICKKIHGNKLSAMKDLLNTILVELHRFWPRYDPHRKGATIKSFLTTYTQTAMGHVSQGRNEFYRRVTDAHVTTSADYAMEYHPVEFLAAFAATEQGKKVKITLTLKRGFHGTEVVTREYDYKSVENAIGKYSARHSSASLDDPLNEETDTTRANLISASCGMVDGDNIQELHREPFLEKFWEIANELFEEIINDPERKRGQRDIDIAKVILFERDEKGKKLTLSAVGRRFGLSRERVRQLKLEISKKLKNRLKGNLTKREKEILKLYFFGASDDFGIEEAIDLHNLTTN
jgi:hypothetical protein